MARSRRPTHRGQTDQHQTDQQRSPWARRKISALTAPYPIALIVTISLGLSLGGCSTLGISGSSPTGENEQANNQFVDRSVRGSSIVSKMLPVRLRLRNGWQPAPANTLHSNADLQAYNPDNDIFLLVLGESKANLGAGSIEDHAAQYLQLMKGGFDQVISNEARTGVESVSGFPAVQHELRGEVLGKSVAYLHTTIEMNDYYYQVVVWTPDTLHASNAEEMRAIVQEFGPDPG